MKTAPLFRLALKRPAFANPPALANRLTVLAFAAFLALPLAGSLVRKPYRPESENRPLHPAPPLPRKRWQFQSFPFVFDDYFADRTGFRKELLRLRRSILYTALGDSISDTVIPGREGWLFLNVVGPSGLPAVQTGHRANVQGWSDALAERRRWLAERGIRYVVAVVPEKSSVYPEYLPEWVRRHPPQDGVAILKETVPIVDLLPALLAAKATTPGLYFKRDSHWTDAGAYPAYRELGAVLEREVPGFQAKPFDRFRPVPWMAERCDLVRALDYPKSNWTEEMALYSVPHNPVAMLPTDGLKALTEIHDDRLRHIEQYVVECATGTGRAVLLNDSFGGNILRMLSSDFRRLVSTGTYGLPTNLIEAEKPDVVIQLFVARAPAVMKASRLVK